MPKERVDAVNDFGILWKTTEPRPVKTLPDQPTQRLKVRDCSASSQEVAVLHGPSSRPHPLFLFLLCPDIFCYPSVQVCSGRLSQFLKAFLGCTRSYMIVLDTVAILTLF